MWATALLIFATLVDGAQSGVVEFDLMIKEWEQPPPLNLTHNLHFDWIS